MFFHTFREVPVRLFGIFYFPKSTGETWVTKISNFHMTQQLQSNQQMDDLRIIGERMWFISVKIAPHYHNIINPEQGGENYNCSITLCLKPLHVVLLGQTV